MPETAPLFLDAQGRLFKVEHLRHFFRICNQSFKKRAFKMKVTLADCSFSFNVISSKPILERRKWLKCSEMLAVSITLQMCISQCRLHPNPQEKGTVKKQVPPTWRWLFWWFLQTTGSLLLSVLDYIKCPLILYRSIAGISISRTVDFQLPSSSTRIPPTHLKTTPFSQTWYHLVPGPLFSWFPFLMPWCYGHALQNTQGHPTHVVWDPIHLSNGQTYCAN